VNRTFDVGVIDEIQMIGSPTRGYAWTRAFLGLQAREIHVCGSLEAETLVRKLCKTTGDDFELRTYDRMTPLKVSDDCGGGGGGGGGLCSSSWFHPVFVLLEKGNERTIINTFT